MSAARRVLLVGGTGYLGGRLARALDSEGWQVTVAARSRHAWPAGLAADFQPLQLPTTAPELRPLLAGQDAVVNLAAANEILAAADPAQAMRITAGGTAALVEAAIAAGVPRYLQLSTVHVYGTPEGRFDETRPPSPQHPYAAAHLAAEQHVQAARAAGWLDGRVLRLANVVGAPASPAVERWTLLANDLCRQAVIGRALRLRSDGLAWRSFLPLDAALAAIRHLLLLPEAVADGLYHLGGPSCQVIALARHVAALAGPDVTVAVGPPSPASVPFALDCTRLAVGGCAPPLQLDAALAETLAFCRRHAASLAGEARS